MADQILDGIRVLDLSTGLSGPVATLLLAEAGADVVKVEPPGGDPIRSLQPSAFATWNRSKQSVELDLDDPRAVDALLAMLEGADVVVHGFTQSSARRFGLDDASLTARFPRLVVCGITGYPVNHPDAERPGYDLLVQARGGLMDVQAGWSDGPFAWRIPIPSWFAGLLAGVGIVARLYHRLHSGRGGVAHASLLQGLRLAESMNWCQAENPPPSIANGPAAAMRMPQVAQYECADGRWLQILNPADRIDLSVMPLTVRALEQLGLTDVSFDAGIFAAAMLQFSSDEWMEEIRAMDVAVELIVPLGTLLDHEEVLANQFVVDVDDPVHGRTRQAAAPMGLDPPMQVRSAAPALGQHNDAVASPWTGEASGARAQTASDGTHPLEGVKVLDIGAFLAGPLAPMLLSDLGADVIKVEPVSGDPIRGWRDEFFIACNRGKRGIALDITTPDGADVLKRLVGWADVVAHNIRPAASERLGIDEEGLRKVNPDVVFGHGTSYGRFGTRSSWPGYDSVFQAMSGWNYEIAGEGNPPLFNHLGNLDMMTGTVSAMASVLALYQRAATGRATSAHAALLHTTTFSNSETFLLLDEGGTTAPYPRLRSDQMGLSPGYRIFRVADGWVAVAALGEEKLRGLVDAAGAASADGVADALANRATADVLGALDARGVPAEAVVLEAWRTVFDDQANLDSQVVASYPQPDWGEMRQFGAYWNFGDLELKLDRACPSLGQHTEELLAEFGYDDAAIRSLAAARVVAGPGLPVE